MDLASKTARFAKSKHFAAWEVFFAILALGMLVFALAGCSSVHSTAVDVQTAWQDVQAAETDPKTDPAKLAAVKKAMTDAIGKLVEATK